MQRLNDQVSVEIDRYNMVTPVISLRSALSYIEWTNTEVRQSNTSTVTLRVVGGDEKGSLESETVKYGHESYGTRTRK
jgi:hypothetical protein